MRFRDEADKPHQERAWEFDVAVDVAVHGKCNLVSSTRGSTLRDWGTGMRGWENWTGDLGIAHLFLPHAARGPTAEPGLHVEDPTRRGLDTTVARHAKVSRVNRVHHS